MSTVQETSIAQRIRMAARGLIQDDELQFIGMCQYCNFQRPLIVVNEYVSPTCGDSHCQEAAVLANSERNAQKRGRRR